MGIPAQNVSQMRRSPLFHFCILKEAMTKNKEDSYMWFVRWEIREVKMKWQILPFSFKVMFLT